jgi:hypothetical protein
MHPQLILFEGLPGSGKSTACQWVANQLCQNRTPAAWLYELSSCNPLKAGPKLAEISDKDLLDFGVGSWESFLKHFNKEKKTLVLDAGLFQHITLEAFYRDLPSDKILDYFETIDQMLAATNSRLIYFSSDDPADHIGQTYSLRGNRFAEALTAWTDKSQFTQRTQRPGHLRSLHFWEGFSALCSKLFEKSVVDKLKIDLSLVSPQWLKYQMNIAEFLDFIPIDTHCEFDADPFVGSFSCDANNKRFEIIRENSQLLAINLLQPLNEFRP